MKCARLLITLATLTALVGSALAQEPMAPEMFNALPPMAAGPVYSDCPPDVGQWSGGQVCQRTSRGYLSAACFRVHRKGAAPRPIAQTTVGGVRMLDTADLNFGVESAPRIIAGYVLPNDVAIEGTFFYKDDLDAVGDATAVNNVTFPFAAPLGLVDDYVAADNINLRLATGIHSYELNLVETTRIFNFIAGFRYMEVRDNMTITATDAGDVSTSTVGTYNHLWGGQIGFRSGYNWELLGVEVTGKAGYYINDGQATTLLRDNNNATTVRNVRVAGQNDAFAGELSAKLSYRPLPYLSIQGGYQCFWITETALAPDQLNTVNPAISGTALNAHGDMFYHGPSVGAELRW